MAVERPIRAGFAPAAGSARLVALRWGVLVVGSVPGLVAARRALAAGPALQPWYADAPSPLPVVQLFRLLGEIPGSVWGLFAGGVAASLVVQQLVTAGAVDVLAPGAGPEPRVLRSVFVGGPARIGTYLRIVVLAAVLLALGGAAAEAAFGRIHDHGALAGWTAETLVVTLPCARVATLLLWASVVGAFAHWCKVLAAADDRRLVRRTALLVLAVWRRRPLAGPLFYAGVSTVTLVFGVAVVVTWRQGGGSYVWWAAASAIGLAAQCVLWHWLVRAALLVYFGDGLADVRARPDEPFGVLRRLRRRRAE